MNQQPAYPEIGIRPIIDGRLGGAGSHLFVCTMYRKKRFSVHLHGMPLVLITKELIIGHAVLTGLCINKI